MTPTEAKTACRALGLRRARLYALIDRYRGEPVMSSMLVAKPGPPRGAWRLADDVEAVLEEAIRSYYLSRLKPSVSALHDLFANCAAPEGSPCHSALRSASELRPGTGAGSWGHRRICSKSHSKPIATKNQ